MLRVLLIILFSNQLALLAQSNYEEEKNRLMMLIDMSFGVNENSRVFVGAKEDDGFYTEVSKKSSDFDISFERARKLVECDPCKHSKTFETENPTNGVYQDLKVNDIYVITKKNDGYGKNSLEKSRELIYNFPKIAFEFYLSIPPLPQALINLSD